MQAESPEWTPASSMCSITAGTKTCSPSQMASASHSVAWCRKRSIRMGRSGVTPTACLPCSQLSVSVVMHDFHAAAAQHVGGANHDRVADAARQSPGRRPRSTAMPDFGHGDLELVHHRAEKVAVLGHVDGLRGWCPGCCTPAFFSSAARLSGVWPPNWAMTPSGFSFSWMAQHVLQGQRLEIELIGGVVVGGNRLRVAVDDDRLKAQVLAAPWPHARSSSRTRCPGRCGWGRRRGS